MSDTITITGIRGFGRHGVFEHERIDGQEFVVDVELTINATRAAATDDLVHSVDYGHVARLAHEAIVGDAVNLIETLAARIADAVVDLPGVLAVRVTVHKPSAPIPVPFDDVAVTVVRP